MEKFLQSIGVARRKIDWFKSKIYVVCFFLLLLVSPYVVNEFLGIIYKYMDKQYNFIQIIL